MTHLKLKIFFVYSPRSMKANCHHAKPLCEAVIGTVFTWHQQQRSPSNSSMEHHLSAIWKVLKFNVIIIMCIYIYIYVIYDCTALRTECRARLREVAAFLRIHCLAAA